MSFYVANTDAVVRFPYQRGDTRISAKGEKLVDLPAGPRNHHWTKNLIANRDGTKLYVTTGSNSNVAEHGMDEEAGRAAIWEIDRKSGGHRIFATGLRNPNGMGWEPKSGILWTVVNERDELGSDLVPDYLTSVQSGGFYGWPYSYYGANVDKRVKPPRPDLVAKAIKPDYALGNHVAPLGLAFSEEPTCPSAKAPTSASTARGTAGRPAATTWSSSRSATASRRGRRSKCCRGSSAPRATPTAGRSAWRSTGAARCWWPTTSAMRSGA